MSASEIPTDLLFQSSHEWARIDGDIATVGVTNIQGTCTGGHKRHLGIRYLQITGATAKADGPVGCLLYHGNIVGAGRIDCA